MFQRFLAQMSALPSSHESGKPEERKRTTELLYPPYGKHLERKREKTDRLGRDYRRRLAPDATVMSWRGMEGGIKSAKAGHHVIMTADPNIATSTSGKENHLSNRTPTLCAA